MKNMIYEIDSDIDYSTFRLKKFVNKNHKFTIYDNKSLKSKINKGILITIHSKGGYILQLK